MRCLPRQLDENWACAWIINFSGFFWDHSMTPGPKQCSVTREIPKMTHRFVWFDSQKKMGPIYWPLWNGEEESTLFFLGGRNRVLRVRQSALFDPLKTPGEMTWNDTKPIPLMTTTSMEEVFFKHHGSPTGHLRLCVAGNAKSTPVIDGKQKIAWHHDIPH